MAAYRRPGSVEPDAIRIVRIIHGGRNEQDLHRFLVELGGVGRVGRNDPDITGIYLPGEVADRDRPASIQDVADFVVGDVNVFTERSLVSLEDEHAGLRPMADIRAFEDILRGQSIRVNGFLQAGHVDGGVLTQTLAETMLWLWRGYPIE